MPLSGNLLTSRVRGGVSPADLTNFFDILEAQISAGLCCKPARTLDPPVRPVGGLIRSERLYRVLARSVKNRSVMNTQIRENVSGKMKTPLSRVFC